MQIVICDDEPLARARLARMLADSELDASVVGEAENGEEALSLVEQLQPDLVLLDIQMPGMTGLEAAQHISHMAEPPAIVFCTAYDEYAVKAFQVNAVGYLLKPVRQEDLLETIQRASVINKAQLQSVKAEIAEHDDDNELKARSHISAKTHRGIELIPIDDIRYFKADQKYVVVRHLGGEVLVDETLKEFEEELGNRFVRVHRNALVSVTHISGLEMVSAGQYQICFKDLDDKIQISRRHLGNLRKLVQNL
jgi:two-component system response regulator AlgR